MANTDLTIDSTADLIFDLIKLSKPQLLQRCKNLNIKGYSQKNKLDLVKLIDNKLKTPDSNLPIRPQQFNFSIKSSKSDLIQMCKVLNIKKYSQKSKSELVRLINNENIKEQTTISFDIDTNINANTATNTDF
jgi:hypothetical protein